ncbi:hypothetical protein LTR08_004862 [Meristemomyces frigidus]|nr:hypothetical protein LTR08_004862 [Meristemomyces frigidus]
MAAPPFKVRAVYDYSSEHADDLKFPNGQIIQVTEFEGDDWYAGHYTDASGRQQEGIFPMNFVEKYEPEVPTRPTRAARPKSVFVAPKPAPAPAQREEEDPEEEAMPSPVAPKPQPPPVQIPAASSKAENPRSPQSSTSQKTPITRSEPPAAPKPAPVEPVSQASTPSRAGPPPIAPKSNAFKDRIAAFNKAEQPPVAQIQPGKLAPRHDYTIKKPFVAQPPIRNAYIPPAAKVEPVHKPYMREEDPEIKQKQDEDRAAAEAAGLTGNPPAPQTQEEEEDAPKPMLSLKERMAMLRREQEAQQARHADATPYREKKAPPKQPSGSSERAVVPEGEDEGVERVRSPAVERQSLDMPRERPRVSSGQRQPLPPVSAAPEHEILGGEEADHTSVGEAATEDRAGAVARDESDERSAQAVRAPADSAQEPDVGEEGNETEAGEEEEELDEEEQRKQRLRERMAKLSGGQGAGPFNPFGAPPPTAAPAKKRTTKDTAAADERGISSPLQQQMVAVPGMGGMSMPRMQSPEPDATHQVIRRETAPEQDTEVDEESEELLPPPRRSTAEDRGAPPPVLKERPVPQPPTQPRAVPPPPAPTPSESMRPTPRPPPTESRPLPPPPPPATPMSPGPGSESDDEMSVHAKRSSNETSGVETPLPVRTGAPPVPTSRDVPPRPPQSPLTNNKRVSYFNSEPSSATSDRRASRVPPPIPGVSGSPVTSPRPPPPPPPTAAPPSRQNTDLQVPVDTERGESDYEGDYDTDIASSAKHKDALKAHNRVPSLDDSTTADELTPPQSAPRAVPPPPPSAMPMTRQSIDAPRAPPPVPPPTREETVEDNYDPYRYPEASRPPPPVPSGATIPAFPIPLLSEPRTEGADDSSADEVPGGAALPRKSTDRAPPQPLQAAPQERAPPMPPIATSQLPPPPARSATRQSLDVAKSPAVGRASMDQQGRPNADQLGQIAQDVDLSHGTQWWTASQPLPPALQKRNGIDLLSESEESQKAKRGGRTTISKDIYVLYMDYSQTIITAQYDSRDPTDVILEQRHEPPPPRLRQDQLESYWQRFGIKIAAAANSVGNSKKDAVVGDGSSYSLPLELIKTQSEALLPVGTRAYGALVYANLANASTQQFDEIRPGDILTARNAKFEGHHGTMRQKYKQDYGPSHVAVVDEWDGTRRAVRAWEQGREKKEKVRSEKFRLGDLRSGEVRVWRVVGRDWVGWDN